MDVDEFEARVYECMARAIAEGVDITDSPGRLVAMKVAPVSELDDGGEIRLFERLRWLLRRFLRA